MRLWRDRVKLGQATPAATLQELAHELCTQALSAECWVHCNLQNLHATTHHVTRSHWQLCQASTILLSCESPV